MFNLCQTLIRHNLPNICKSSMQAPPEFSKQDRPLKPILPRQRAVSSAMFKISPVLINTLLQRGVNGRREASGVQSSKFGSWLFSGCWMLALGCFRRSRHPRRAPPPTLLRAPPAPMLRGHFSSSPPTRLRWHLPDLIPMRAFSRLPQTLCAPMRFLNSNGKPTQSFHRNHHPFLIPIPALCSKLLQPTHHSLSKSCLCHPDSSRHPFLWAWNFHE